MDRRAILRVDIGLYVSRYNMAPAKLLIQDPCPFGQPVIMTAAMLGPSICGNPYMLLLCSLPSLAKLYCDLP